MWPVTARSSIEGAAESTNHRILSTKETRPSAGASSGARAIDTGNDVTQAVPAQANAKTHRGRNGDAPEAPYRRAVPLRSDRREAPAASRNWRGRTDDKDWRRGRRLVPSGEPRLHQKAGRRQQHEGQPDGHGEEHQDAKRRPSSPVGFQAGEGMTGSSRRLAASRPTCRRRCPAGVRSRADPWA